MDKYYNDNKHNPDIVFLKDLTREQVDGVKIRKEQVKLIKKQRAFGKKNIVNRERDEFGRLLPGSAISRKTTPESRRILYQRLFDVVIIRKDYLKICKALLKKALQGDMRAIGIIMNHTLPKEKPAVNVNEKTNQINFTFPISNVNFHEKDKKEGKEIKHIKSKETA